MSLALSARLANLDWPLAMEGHDNEEVSKWRTSDREDGVSLCVVMLQESIFQYEGISLTRLVYWGEMLGVYVYLHMRMQSTIPFGKCCVGLSPSRLLRWSMQKKKTGQWSLLPGCGSVCEHA